MPTIHESDQSIQQILPERLSARWYKSRITLSLDRQKRDLALLEILMEFGIHTLVIPIIIE